MIWLRIFNESENADIERIWIYKNSIGTLRQVYIIIANENFAIKGNFVCKTLDLGSDHRAVVGEVYVK